MARVARRRTQPESGDSMNATPKPVRPIRRFEVYAVEGETIELPAAEVDRNGGSAVVAGREVLIQWRCEAANA